MITSFLGREEEINHIFENLLTRSHEEQNSGTSLEQENALKLPTFHTLHPFLPAGLHMPEFTCLIL